MKLTKKAGLNQVMDWGKYKINKKRNGSHLPTREQNFESSIMTRYMHCIYYRYTVYANTNFYLYARLYTFHHDFRSHHGVKGG